MAKVKIVDVARAAGVSLGTVSNALNHPEKVRPETRRLIDETIRRLGYTPNQSARALAGGVNKMLGLVLPRLDHGFCLQIIHGAQVEALKHGYTLLVAASEGDPDIEMRNLDYFMGAQLAGILLQPIERRAWEPLQNPATPLVYLDTRPAASGGAFVYADAIAQGRLIAEHARDGGAHRIAVIGCATTRPLRERIEGIKDALYGATDVTLDVLDAGEWNVSGDGYGIGRELARRSADVRPDFIIALTDVLGTGAVAGIRDAGLSVPHDIKVAGCDGNPLAWSGGTSLTTCAPAGYEVGRKGVQILIEHIREPRDTGGGSARRHIGRTLSDLKATEPRVEVVRPFLLERASTCDETNANGHTAFASHVPETNLGAYL